MITFPVLTAAPLTHNALFSGVSDSRLRQTQAEHERLLDIMTLPGAQDIINHPNSVLREIGMANLKKLAEAREKACPKYWDDEEPRPDNGEYPLSSSSWIGNVSYRPGVAIVHIGDREYYCPMDEVTLKEFLESPSLGRFFNKHIRGKYGKFK